MARVAMQIELTRHVAERMERRNLFSLIWIEQTVRNADRRETDPGDPELVRAYRAIPEMGNRILRVVFLPITPARCRVITAFFDREAGSGSF